MLLRSEIYKQIQQGNISITPFNYANLGVNSYDVTLAPELKVYLSPVLDMRYLNLTRSIAIPEEGFVLQPGEFYLGSTNEIAGAKGFIPMYEGRSSLARLGIKSHFSAGFGDIGFVGSWTLEIAVQKPVRIYPNIRIGQVYFQKGEGQIECYDGKYNYQQGANPSKSYLDFEPQLTTLCSLSTNNDPKLAPVSFNHE